MEKNNNLKVRLVRPYEEENIPEGFHVIEMPSQRVSVAMRNEFPSWCSGQPVLIAAPTGSGKTTFVTDIVRFCQRKTPKKKVLFLAHRVAIVTQQKMAFAQALKSKWRKITAPLAFEYIDDLDDVGLCVMTYQSFAKKYRKLDLNEFSWVVLDEIHGFYTDALFNIDLDQLLTKIPQLLQHAHRLYLTATPGAILGDLIRVETDNLTTCASCRYNLCEHAGKFLLYLFPNQFQQISLQYYRHIDEIINLVRENPTEKFLIFTSARDSGDSNDIGDTKSYRSSSTSHCITVGYLDSTTKDSDLWRQVCTTGRFDKQVLVCTSVLDCGVNLNDPDLHHIVIESLDKTEFLQMIGRKRLRANERLRVYIRVPGVQSLQSRLHDVQKSLQICNKGLSAERTHRFDPLIRNGWLDESPEQLYRHLLNYDGHGSVSTKLTAYHHLRWQQGTLTRLLRDTDTLGDDSALPRLAHEWLEQGPDAYDPSRWLDAPKKADARASLLKLLESHLGDSITKAAWTVFSENAQDLTQQLHSFPHNKERVLGYLALNSRLTKLDIPFQIQRANGLCQVFRTGGELHE